ncbi:MAG: response regulator [Leptospira sp.]|nr:response regulator [Leptospira sp.]
MKIKILILEDNPLIQLGYKKAFETIPDFEIVRIVSNGEEGLIVLDSEEIDVILCDLNMPRMDGFEFTKRCMSTKPKPILIVSDLVQSENTEEIFKVLNYGAVEVLPKPKIGGDISLLRLELEKKIRILAGVIVFTKKESASKLRSFQRVDTTIDFPSERKISKDTLVMIGASTGGPQAFQQIFAAVPSDFPAPIFSVQHISNGFGQGMVEWLSQICPLKLHYLTDDTEWEPGHVYFPKDDHHLVLDGTKVRLEQSEKVRGHRPSVDQLFLSLTEYQCKKTLAFLLTGMGDDGAIGLKRIKDFGGYTFAQDEASSVVYGMPRVALELGGVCSVLSLEDIVTIFKTGVY